MSGLIRVLLSAQSIQLRPGEETDLTFTVQNFSEIVDRYRITVEGVDPSWVSISRTEVSLFPKDQDLVRITLHPPEGSGTRAGHHDIRVQATSQDNPAEWTAAPVDLEVVPVGALEVALRPQRQSGLGGGTFTLQLRNQGNVDVTVQIGATDPEDGCLYTFSPAQPVVPAGQERAVQLEVRPKVLVPGKEPHSYAFTVTAKPLETPQLVRQVQGEWVQIPPPIEMVLYPPKQSGIIEGNYHLQVKNQGSTNLTVQLSASDPADGCWYLAQPNQVTVPAGQEQAVELRLRPKAALPGKEPRTHAFTVTARMADMPQMTRQVQGEWTQLPLALEMVLQPLKQSGASEGAFTVQIANRGGTDLTVQLEATDPAQGCLYTINPPQVLVPAGQQQVVQLTVRPKYALPSPQPLTYRFAVTGRPAAMPQATVQAQGEWEQVAWSQPRPTPKPAAAFKFWPLALAMWLGLGATIGLGFLVGNLVQQVLRPSPMDYSAIEVLIWICAIVTWLAGVVVTLLIARKVWKRPKFGAIAAVFLGGVIVTILVSFVVGLALERRQPLPIMVVVWLVGIVLTTILARAVAKKSAG